MLMQLIEAAIYLVNWPEDGVGWSPSTDQVNWVDPVGPAAGILQHGEFAVLRNGVVSTKTLQLSAPAVATVVNRIEPLFIALVFWVLGISVFAFNSADVSARLFHCIFSYVGCGVLVFGALSTTGLFWADRLFYLSMWLLGPLLVHLHLNLPAPLAIPHRRLVIVAL